MSLKTPYVSVVIPAYNYAGYLREAIESVLTQDYPYVELIVIDDGSTDETASILRDYSSRARCESQANAGQSRALNKGWDLSKGEILGYLSADDVLYPRAISHSVETLASDSRAVASYPDFDLIDAESKPIRKVLRPEFSLERLIGDVECLPGPGAFFRRSAWRRAGPWNPAIKQMPDYDFWARLALQGHFLRISKVLAGFRVHEESQTFRAVDIARAEEPVEVIDSLFRIPESASLRHLQIRAIANANLLSAQLHGRAGRWQTAGRRLRNAYVTDRMQVFKASTVRKIANVVANRTGHRMLQNFRKLSKP